MKVFELTPINGRKSFYGKAKVISDNINIADKLQSYDTIVAERTNNIVKIHGWYSSTTATHINSFLALYGIDPLTKKQMQEKPTITIK